MFLSAQSLDGAESFDLNKNVSPRQDEERNSLKTVFTCYRLETMKFGLKWSINTLVVSGQYIYMDTKIKVETFLDVNRPVCRLDMKG